MDIFDLLRNVKFTVVNGSDELRHTVKQVHDHGPDDNCEACYQNEPQQFSNVSQIQGRLS